MGPYQRRVSEGLGRALGILLVAAAIAAVVIAGWQLGWWMQSASVNRQGHIIRNSYGNQQTLRDRIDQHLSGQGGVLDISTQISRTQDPAVRQQLAAQRYAVLGMLCREAEQVSGDPLPPDQARFVGQNCAGAGVSATSQYAPR